MRSSPVHKHWIKPVKSHHGEEITRADKVRRELYFLDLSLFHLVIHSPIQPFKVCLNQVFRYLRIEKWILSMKSKSTHFLEFHKRFYCCQHRQNFVFERFTEQICLQPVYLEVLDRCIPSYLESQDMPSGFEESLNLVDFSVCHKKGIRAQKWSFTLELGNFIIFLWRIADNNLELRRCIIFKAKNYTFKAVSFCL
mgnify:CR=1 FL=1